MYMILIGREHISRHTRQFSAARTPLAMWQVIATQETWRNDADVLACFPRAKFVTTKIVRFFPIGGNCVVTTQIAFNTGVLIVLAVTEVESSQIEGS